MAYLSLDEFTGYVGSELAADRTSLQAALLAAEQAINDHCGRNFNTTATSATARSYLPCGDVVVTHDIGDTTGLIISNFGSTVASGTYQLEPNPVSWAGVTQPYYRIRLLNGAYWTQSGGQATVTVTAKWGWPAVPAQVVEATAILAKDLAHLRQNRFGVAGFGEYGVIRVRDNPHVVMLLSRLRHPMAVGIG